MNCVCYIKEFVYDGNEPKVDVVKVDFERIFYPRVGEYVSYPSFPYDVCVVEKVKKIYDEGGNLDMFEIILEEEKSCEFELIKNWMV